MHRRQIIGMVGITACALAVAGCSEDGEWPVDPVVPETPMVVINEFLVGADTTTTEACGTADWIELYNADTIAVPLADLAMTDTPGEAVPWIITSGDTLMPGDWCVICADGEPARGPLHAPFRIKAGETLVLATEWGAIVDSITSPLLDDDESYARIPDGTSTWSQSATPTPGGPNQ